MNRVKQVHELKRHFQNMSTAERFLEEMDRLRDKELRLVATWWP